MKNTTIKQSKNHQKNIDAQEINRFNSFATEWWNTSGAFKSLHYINSIRFNYILEKSNGLFKKKVLDIGCGGGILSESFAQAGADVVGLDMSSNSLKEAKLHALKHDLSIKYIQETIEKHSKYYTNHYDVVTCMEVLEHVPHPLSIIHACSIVVKPKGSVFFSTLNRTFKAWLLIILGAEYILQIIPKNTHNFNKFITPAELLNWIDSTTLEEQNIIGIHYNPITNKCTLTHNINMNYILHAQRKI